jgi:hypothetical protein
LLCLSLGVRGIALGHQERSTLRQSSVPLNLDGNVVKIGVAKAMGVAMGMRTIAAIAADSMGRFLAKDFRRTFGSGHQDVAERLDSIAQIALECLGRSDALYHNLEHTMLVTMVGRDILRGKTLTERIEPTDYAHLIVACLLHDIGYVRGVLRGDKGDEFVVDADGRTVKLPRGASDAALAPYHVERSKIFVHERMGHSPTINAARVAEAIELTRFPASDQDGPSQPLEPRLVQAADLIGQLGDPLYLRKANALFYEFEENGTNRQLGYSSPADVVEKYPDLYWRSMSTQIEAAVDYLNVTVSGRQWIANLHSHLFCAERAYRLMGPQR